MGPEAPVGWGPSGEHRRTRPTLRRPAGPWLLPVRFHLLPRLRRPRSPASHLRLPLNPAGFPWASLSSNLPRGEPAKTNLRRNLVVFSDSEVFQKQKSPAPAPRPASPGRVGGQEPGSGAAGWGSARGWARTGRRGYVGLSPGPRGSERRPSPPSLRLHHPRSEINVG